ncbi:MAG: AbrB family transcriptional regulator [Chloroflexi bacterium]|nr:AbrB family transcriptional regulator [Chloroflexota bacterium]
MRQDDHVRLLKKGARVLGTLALGTLGALGARTLAMPGGAFIGAIAITAIARLLNAPLDRPPRWARSIGRVALGLTIGVAVTGETLRTIARAQLPVMVIIFGLMFLGLGTAVIISKFTHMPLPTALCSASPGALSAMVTLADDLGGDGPVVASMHLVRLLSVTLIVPPLVYGRFGGGPETLAAASATAGSAQAAPALWLAALLAVGLFTGLLLVRLGLPGGDLIAGVVVSALASSWLGLSALPSSWRMAAQILVAADIGTTMSREALRSFRPFILAGGLMTAFLIVSGFGLGWVLAQISPLDLATSIMGSAPGGADTMMILAGELGADQPLVTAMHTSRLITLTIVLPLFVRLANARVSKKREMKEPAEALTCE